MMKTGTRTTLLAACLASPWLASTSQAATLEFKGTGSICSYEVDGSCVPSGSVDFTATVQYQVLSAAPSGPDSIINVYSDPSFTIRSQTDYGEDSPWVVSTYTFQWAGGSYTWAAVANADTVSRIAKTRVYTDSASTEEYVYAGARSDRIVDIGSFEAGGTYTAMDSQAGISQRSSGPGMLQGLDFSLSTQVSAYNTQLSFSESTLVCVYGPSGGSSDCTTSGFQAEFFATSATVVNDGSVPAVPEPATWLMCVAGLGALALRRRGLAVSAT